MRLVHYIYIMKKQILFALLVCGLIQHVTLAQSYLNKFYHYNYPVATFTGLVYDNDTIITTGIITEWSSQDLGKGYHAKFDMNGEILTFKAPNISNENSFRPYIHTLSKASDGGYFYSGPSDLYANYGKSFLCKLNHNLDTVWFKEFVHGDSLTQIIAKGNIELVNKHYLLVCEIWYPNGTGHDILLIETDSNGIEINRTVYGYPLGHPQPAVGEQVQDVLAAPWGILIGGSGATNPNTNKGASFIIKLDSTGNKIGDYFTSFSDSVNAQAFAMSNNGFIGLCGRQGFKELAPNTYDGRCYIAKYNSIFGKIWGRKLPENFFYNDFYKMIGTYDNVFLACGRHETNAGWMVKVSQYGQVEWSRKHQVFYDWNWQYDHYFYDVVELPDKGFALVGTAYDNTQATSPTVTNAWLARTDSFGCLVPGCETVGIAESTPLESSFKLYPNPASDRLFLYYNNPQLQNCVFAVRDIAGRQLVPPTPLENSTTYEIRIGNWAKGLYFVELRDEKGNVHTEKFVKE